LFDGLPEGVIAGADLPREQTGKHKIKGVIEPNVFDESRSRNQIKTLGRYRHPSMGVPTQGLHQVKVLACADRNAVFAQLIKEIEEHSFPCDSLSSLKAAKILFVFDQRPDVRYGGCGTGPLTRTEAALMKQNLNPVDKL